MAWLPEHGVGAAAVVNSHDEDIRHRVVPALLGRAVPRPEPAPAPAPRAARPPTRPEPDAPLDVTHRQGRYAGALHQTLEFAVRDGRFGRVDGDGFEPLVFVDADNAVAQVTNERYRFMPANAEGSLAPRYIVRVRDGESWSYNDGPADPRGPNRAEWEKLLGDYALVTRDGLTARVPVTIRNGHLYIASQKISEDRTFRFTPRGEHVEFDGDIIRVGHRTLQRIE
jgi:hypothetical protein